MRRRKPLGIVPDPGVRGRGASRARRWMSLVFLSVCAFRAFPEEPDIPALEDRAAKAAREGDYGAAARILREARQSWPGEPRIPLLLGDLYTDRELHTLALDEYREAEKLDPENPEILQRIADGYGFLNREEDSIRYLERILGRDPGNQRALGDLGWMLFKTHKLQEGIRILEDAEKSLGRDIGFSMTLGTLRAELFDYGEARHRYEEAISEARAQGYIRFTSVAYYNLSLLESRFRLWDRALEAADMSIRTEPRPSGYLARGELRLRRMEQRAAVEDFRSAYGLDTTPLARLSLAEAALSSGRPEEALAWIREVAELEDHPWMASFGTDPESFSMDLHELFWKAYKARAALRARRPGADRKETLRSRVGALADRVRAAYHERLFRKAARAVAAAYRREGANLPAAVYAVQAFWPYPRLARKYLEEARDRETVHVPGAAAVYDLEAAILDRDAAALSAAIARLDPVWERDVEAEGLGELAGLLFRSGRGEEGRAALERLWLLSPGALAPQGFSVPALVKLEVSSDVASRTTAGLERRLRRLGMGFKGEKDEAFGFFLRLRVDREGADYTLTQRSSGAVLRTGSVRFGSSGPSAGGMARFLFDSLNGTGL